MRSVQLHVNIRGETKCAWECNGVYDGNVKILAVPDIL